MHIIILIISLLIYSRKCLEESKFPACYIDESDMQDVDETINFLHTRVSNMRSVNAADQINGLSTNNDKNINDIPSCFAIEPEYLSKYAIHVKFRTTEFGLKLLSSFKDNMPQRNVQDYVKVMKLKESYNSGDPAKFCQEYKKSGFRVSKAVELYCNNL